MYLAFSILGGVYRPCTASCRHTRSSVHARCGKPSARAAASYEPPMYAGLMRDRSPPFGDSIPAYRARTLMACACGSPWQTVLIASRARRFEASGVACVRGTSRWCAAEAFEVGGGTGNCSMVISCTVWACVRDGRIRLSARKVAMRSMPIGGSVASRI